ncbi:hypothetical protein DPEC_G00124690 [Dallia pectoralis]|uniref:Uncharacterized protein n=1 Tax=Dallia pectoralis TaxID=75939 RepID=A0ACC2GQY2_DALPE|nr:hypothetical protein DPEC_G00124690 [Dallia pectoralis]
MRRMYPCHGISQDVPVTLIRIALSVGSVPDEGTVLQETEHTMKAWKTDCGAGIPGEVQSPICTPSIPVLQSHLFACRNTLGPR